MHDTSYIEFIKDGRNFLHINVNVEKGGVWESRTKRFPIETKILTDDWSEDVNTWAVGRFQYKPNKKIALNILWQLASTWATVTDPIDNGDVVSFVVAVEGKMPFRCTVAQLNNSISIMQNGKQVKAIAGVNMASRLNIILKKIFA